MAITDVRAAVTREAPAADTTVRIVPVPAHQRQHLRDAVRRAVDRDDDAQRLLGLLRLMLVARPHPPSAWEATSTAS